MKNYVEKEVNENGDIFYYNKAGQFHRTDGPAVLKRDGTELWFINNKSHRIDGPAYEDFEGYTSWLVNNKQIDESRFNKLQNLRKTINDDDLLNELLLSGQIIL